MPEIYKNGRLYGSGNSGANDYDDLTGHPSINNEEVVGDKTSADYGLASTSDLADKADGAGLTFSVDQRGMVNVTNDNTPTPTYDLPPGGTTGQVLKKASDDDDDVEWADSDYDLPTASSSTLGGVKVDGAVFNVDENGYLTQVGGGAGGGHTILDDGIPMEQEGDLNFVDFDLEDDSTNSQTVVSPHEITSEEWADIIDTLPGTPTDLPVLFDERGTEYQVGWYVNSSGLKKPVYQKIFAINGSDLVFNDDNDIGLSTLSIDNIVSMNGVYYQASGVTLPLDHVHSSGLQYSNGFWITSSSLLALRFGSSQGNVSKVLLTLQYTKTTDTYQ